MTVMYQGAVVRLPDPIPTSQQPKAALSPRQARKLRRFPAAYIAPPQSAGPYFSVILPPSAQ